LFLPSLQLLSGSITFQHCSISTPSTCTIKHVRQYFLEGTLPKPGTVCQVDLGPFDSVEQGSLDEAQGILSTGMNEEDRLLVSALLELSSWPFVPFHHDL
jgi:TAP-like protein